jgi:peroxisomal 3,2-trans-enoyl-CoA isomerase
MQCLGTSIGFGTTTLALCDVVYSVSEASFSTPFMKLGKNEIVIPTKITLILCIAFCAEGCSSVLFPR